eukprot:tig00001437_g8744.t1
MIRATRKDASAAAASSRRRRRCGVAAATARGYSLGSSRITMGKEKIAIRMKGVVEYYTSPFEMKVFGKSFLGDAFAKAEKKVSENWKDVTPGLLYGAVLYFGGNYLFEQEKLHHRD